MLSGFELYPRWVPLARSSTKGQVFSQVAQDHYLCHVRVSFNMSISLFFPKLRAHIKYNNNSPHGKFHRFLFPFSSKFPDLNFAPYVLTLYETRT